MTYATTFSGIGGWEIGLNACGWELKWQCERDEWCRRLLKERFGVPIYPDITTLCGESPAPVDALIGSPPCQPWSISGEKNGAADERHLFPAFIALVRKLRPAYVLMEQVPNIFSFRGGFDEYASGLAALGYDLLWHCIPACAVGAPIRRLRLYLVAVSLRPRRAGILCGNKGVGPIENHWPPPTALDTPSTLIRGVEESICEPAILSRPDGLSLELALSGYGNAVVPQIAYMLGQAINEIEAMKV